jgi:hypothetical protein
MRILSSLDIDQQDCLQVTTEVSNDEIINLYNTYLSFYLKRKQNLLCLRKVNVGYDLYYIAEHIQHCIDNKRNIPLKMSIKFDLGILWNNHIQKIILAEKAGNPLKTWSWPGDSLLLLENQGEGFDSCITWLYNDEKGQIVMQVNTVYPWFFKKVQPDDLDISYDSWLSNYKILYKTIIPKDIAKKWVKDLNDLYAQLDLNT